MKHMVQLDQPSISNALPQTPIEQHQLYALLSERCEALGLSQEQLHGSLDKRELS